MSTDKDSQRSIMARAFKHYTEITSRVLAATVGTVALFGVPGYFLDKWLETSPWIFGVALVLSLPISQVMTIKIMQRYVKDNPQD
ncbi:MAG: AtpZ/AtpI family protein [Patescibacteria group bacterium]